MKILVVIIYIMLLGTVYAHGYKHGELKTRLEQLEEDRKAKQKDADRKAEMQKYRSQLQTYIDQSNVFPLEQTKIRMRKEKKPLPIRR